MVTMAGTAIKMDMLWKLTPCGFTTDTGILSMTQQIQIRDQSVLEILSFPGIKFSDRGVDRNHESSLGPFVGQRL